MVETGERGEKEIGKMNNVQTSNHFRNKALRIAQAAWIILALLSFARFSLSIVVYYQSTGEICVESMQDCHEHQQVGLEDAASLKNDGISLERWAIYNISYRVFSALIYFSIGLLIFALKRDDPVALFISLFLVLFGTTGGFSGYLAFRFPEYHLWFSLIEYPAYVTTALFFFAFPNGRVVPRFMWVFIFIWSLSFLLEILIPFNTDSQFYFIMGSFNWLGLFFGGFASQVYRYLRVSNEVERRQTKWVVFGFGSVAIFLLLGLFLPPFNQMMQNTASYSANYLYTQIFGNLALIGIPISIGIAILRYRLFDIDVIIRRTLVYGLLTAALGLVFFGGVTLMQRVFTTITGQQSAISIVISTLAIAALFNPLRRLIQNTIDRRFYRRKYDTQKALERFAAVARNEVEVGQLSVHMLQVVNEALEPEHTSLWMKPIPKRLKSQ